MPRQPQTVKRYRVGNPREIPKGTRILAFGDEEWFEGDAFVAPEGFTPQAVQECIDAGLIVEVEA